MINAPFAAAQRFDDFLSQDYRQEPFHVRPQMQAQDALCGPRDGPFGRFRIWHRVGIIEHTASVERNGNDWQATGGRSV